jgi:hypothetical protein
MKLFPVWVALVAFVFVVLPRDVEAQVGDSIIIVELLFPGIGQEVILAEVVQGDTVFPVAVVMDLCGHDENSTALVRRETLARMLGPTVGLNFYRDRLLLVIDDPMNSCPRMRDKLDSQVAESRARQAAPSVSRRPGWGVSAIREMDGASQVDAAYNLGPAALFTSYSSEVGFLWSASASPVRGLWLSYTDSETRGPAVSGRYALGRQWFGVSYRADAEILTAQVALAAGPLMLYVSGNDRTDLASAVATWRGPRGIGVQVGKMADRYSARVTIGNMIPTPFSISPVRRY